MATDQPSPAAALAEVESQWVETPVGKVEVKLALPAGEIALALAVFVHGKAPEPEIIWEWSYLLDTLRQRKTAVVLPNLHSCDRTSPTIVGRAPSPDATRDISVALGAITSWALSQTDTGAATPVVVYGKSWGGGRALEFCAHAASAESSLQAPVGLCLACPAIPKDDETASPLKALTAPVLVAWARDDDVIPFPASEPLLAQLRARPEGPTIFVPVDEGKHRVDHMAAGDTSLANKLVEWPDLVLGPLAPGGILAAAARLAAPPPEKKEEEEEQAPPAQPRAGAFDMTGLM